MPGFVYNEAFTDACDGKSVGAELVVWRAPHVIHHSLFPALLFFLFLTDLLPRYPCSLGEASKIRQDPFSICVQVPRDNPLPPAMHMWLMCVTIDAGRKQDRAIGTYQKQEIGDS